MPLFDAQTAKNVAVALPLGLGGGALIALLSRKADLQRLKREGGLASPEARVTIPTLHREPEPAEKSGAVGHLAGLVGGGAAGYHILTKLMVKKHNAMLDSKIAEKDKQLNDLLLQEQSLAAGIPTGDVALVSKAANCRKLHDVITKVAEDMYDVLEKRSDMSLKDLLGSFTTFSQLGSSPFMQALMVVSGLSGGLYGYHAGAKGDPARAMSKAVKDSLKERLTGKDQLMGPMPLRVETEEPSMTPIRPGASSLADPARGRDVLEGI